MTYRSDLCHIRDLHECGCEEVCHQQRKDLPPVIAFTWRDHLVVCITGGIIAVLFYAAMNRADEVFHQQNLIAQETYHHG